MWYLQYYECISFILSCSHVISPILRVYLVYLVVFACDISNITSVSRLFCRVRMWHLQYYECISFILSCSHVISPILRVYLVYLVVFACSRLFSRVRRWYLQYYECISFILSCSHVISPILRVYLVYLVVFACDISNITSVSRLFCRVRMWYLQYYECISFILSCSHVISPILRVYLVYFVVFACDISNITSVSRLFCRVRSDISNITSVSRLFCRVRMWYLQYYECISFILSCSHVISPILRVYLVYFVVFACDISNITSVSRLFCRVRMWYLQYYECISFILSCSRVISPILRVYLVYFVVFPCHISNITSVSRLFCRVRMSHLQYYECISFI